jgi:hypothetical protein
MRWTRSSLPGDDGPAVLTDVLDGWPPLDRRAAVIASRTTGTTAGDIAMTAPAPTRSGLTSLDKRITEALATLRLARRLQARGKSRQDAYAEERAENNLNALLDFRYAAQRR